MAKNHHPTHTHTHTVYTKSHSKFAFLLPFQSILLVKKKQDGNMIYIPFAVGAGAFSLLNACGSVACWYGSSRRIMLFTGAINTAIGGAAVVMYPYDAKLSNFYMCAAATSASAQYFLHAMRTPKLLAPSLMSSLYVFWSISLLVYAFQRAKWVYALRYD